MYMPRFTTADFQGDTATRLGVIAAHKCGLHPLTKFSECPSKKKFNRILNEYVNSLGDDWETTITNDCNTIINEDVLTDNFNPANCHISGLSTTKTLLMTSEQFEMNGLNPAFSEDCNFKIEIVEKPEMFFSPNNIENEPDLPKDSETGCECQEAILSELGTGSEQQSKEL
jgi:hypothetical protein